MGVVPGGRWRASASAVLTIAASAAPFSSLRAQGAAPATTGTVTGRVTQAPGDAPVAGARVQALLLPGRTVAGANTTGGDGRYRIGGLRPGAYALVVTRIGYQLQKVDSLRVAESQTATANISLAELASTLEQVVVTSSRAPEKVLDAPASISVVTTERIEQRSAVTPVDYLRDTPGLNISTAGISQSNVVARGFNNAFSGSLLTLQDYKFAAVPSLRVNAPFLVPGTSEDIERIEVLLGPASALYGPNSANGVMHIITKSPFSSPGTTVSVDGGERSIFRGGLRHAQLLGDKAAFKVSGEYFTGRDFQYRDPAEPATFGAQAPASRQGQPNLRDFDVRRYTGEARVDVRPRDNVEAVTTLGYTHVGSAIELTGANGASQVRNWTYTSVQQRLRWNRLFAQAFANINNAGNDDASDTRGTYLLRTGVPIVDKSRVYAAQLQHGVDLGGDREKLVYGADYIFTNPRTGGTINGRNEAADNVTEVGAYVQSTTRLTPKYDLVGAVRLDRNDRIGGSQFSPRVALAYKPTENHNLRLTYSRAFQTPANFSFFLDLPQATNAGGSGYNIRARGVPPKEGWQYNRTCDAGISGGLCMRSPLVGGGEFVPATASAAFGAFIQARSAAFVAGLQQAGIPAAQAQQIVGFLGTRRPTETDIPTRIAYLTDAGTVNRAPSTFQDIRPLAASYNTNYEAGYKGIIGGRFRLAVDGWYQKRGDVGSAATLATPNVFLSGTATGTYIATQLATGAGVPAAQAQAIAAALAPQIARAPLGLITFANGSTNATDVLATYQVLDKTVDVWGTDVAADLQATDRLVLAATYSHVSKTLFPDVVGVDGRAFALNAPGHTATLTARVQPPAGVGLGFELRGRYTDAFPVNSGVYASGINLPVPNVANTFYQYSAVPVGLFADAGVSYRFLAGGRRALVAVNATNLFDNARPTFAGTADIGRVVLTRVQYSF